MVTWAGLFIFSPPCVSYFRFTKLILIVLQCLSTTFRVPALFFPIYRFASTFNRRLRLQVFPFSDDVVLPVGPFHGRGIGAAGMRAANAISEALLQAVTQQIQQTVLLPLDKILRNLWLAYPPRHRDKTHLPFFILARVR